MKKHYKVSTGYAGNLSQHLWFSNKKEAEKEFNRLKRTQGHNQHVLFTYDADYRLLNRLNS